MNQLDFDAINHALNAEQLVPQWLPGGNRRGAEYVVANPTRSDKNPGSFTINLVRGVWKDYATGDGGSDLVSLYAYLYHQDDQGAAAKELAENNGIKIGDPATRQQAAEANVAKLDEARPEPVLPVPASAPDPKFWHPRWGQPSAVYTYRDRESRVLMHVCRFDPKDERKQVIPLSWCKHPDGTERWTWRGITGTKKRPLYGLERLAADPEADAIVVEGEKAADAGWRITGALVVTWMGGVETASRVNINALAGRRVILWPDADALRDDTGALLPIHEQPGMRAMMALANALRGVAREVVMIGYTPDTERHGWDLADAEAEGWDAQRVAEHMRERAGDPWAIASAKHVTKLADDVPVAPAAPVADVPAGGDHAVALDAAVNPFGWVHMSDKGQPMNTVENLQYMLGEYGISCRYNEVRKNVEVVVPGREYAADNRANCSLAEITSIAARNRMPASMLPDYMKLIGDRNRFNPVADWINSKPHDGATRMQALFDTVQVDGDQGLKEKLMLRWLLSVVAAQFMDTGFESHGALVFTGEQGVGKTTWFRRLMPRELGAILTGAMVDPAQKDTVTNAISHAITELGELDATFRKADIARLKSFITLPMDKLRRPYDRIESEYMRRTVFCASVNDERYLVDDTGNRRWWTVPVVRINYMHDIDMQQLWAEVLVRHRAGEQHWLTPEENAALGKLNSEHENIDPVEESILAAFDWQAVTGHHPMTASEVLAYIGYDKPNKAQATHASKVLKKLTGKDAHRTNRGRFFSLPPRIKGNRQFDHADESRPY